MEVLVRYENGFRFSTTCKGYTVTTGHGENGNKSRDGMWPAQLFEASIGMCIGGYIAKFCKEEGIPYEDMTIELSRRIEASAVSSKQPRVKTRGIAASGYTRPTSSDNFIYGLKPVELRQNIK